jgi:ribose 5-phosphate isomerase B
MKVRVGADHGGFEMKQQLAKLLAKEGHEVVEFGTRYMIPTTNTRILHSPSLGLLPVEKWSEAVSCAAAVGASVAANKSDRRAPLCHDDFSARQGVEDDDLNIFCFGGRTMGIAVAWDCTKNFLGAKFSAAGRHRRRLAKVSQFEASKMAVAHGGK